MSGAETIAIDGARFRIRPWRDDPETAALVNLPGRGHPSTATVTKCLTRLQARGFRSVLTGALSHHECAPFRAAGFATHHELHLLARSLDNIKAPNPRALRRVKRRDWPAVLDIDARAFNSFWRFDHDGIVDALGATPSRRFRVIRSEPIAGYHISGLAGTVGYLQRLAVDPRMHRQGFGSVLINDSLGWMASRGARMVYVNTQVGNDVAVSVYEHHGFTVQAERLTVLTRSLEPAATPQSSRRL